MKKTISILAMLLAFVVQSAADVPITSLESIKGWGAIGRSKAESDPSGATGNCMKITFGIPASQNYMLVQGPTPAAAEAWRRRGDETPNALAFQAATDGDVSLVMNLRVRKRGVSGLPGVVGAARATASLDQGDWRRVVIPFSAFKADRSLGRSVDAQLFEVFDPQLQFSIANSLAPGVQRAVRIDDIAFTTIPPETIEALKRKQEEVAMNWIGLGLVEELPAVKGLARPDWRPMTAPGMEAPEKRSREECLLARGWTFVPVQEKTGKLGAASPVSLPRGFPGRRDYVAGWHLSRVDVRPKRGERVVARFDQVALFSALFVNGKECGRHLGAYTPFEFDITDALVDGDNLLALYVHDASAAVQKGRALNQLGVWRNPAPRRFMGGALGGVWLERRPDIHVGDVFVKTSVRDEELTLVCELINDGAVFKPILVRAVILGWGNEENWGSELRAPTVQLAAGSSRTVTIKTKCRDARLWSPEQPNLYVASVYLNDMTEGAEFVDRLDTRFGFREFSIEGRQFMLNGKPTRLLGESHYRYGKSKASRDPVTGRDFNREMFRVLKDTLGVNAARVHAEICPASVALGADEAGVLLINQSSIWSAMGSGYRRGGEAFLNNTRREFAEWVRRDRNSPSVAIWDVENEMIRGSRENAPWVMRLDDFILEHDDTRPVEHSGAGWYDDQQISHLHMQEHYTKVLDMWQKRGTTPIVIGEFWVGGRGETRLPTSLEFSSRAEWFEEEARVYEEQMLDMREAGASGVMPFRTSTSLLTKDEDGRAVGDYTPGQPPAHAIRSELVRERMVHGLQATTIFFWPRVEAVVAGEATRHELVVCNDSESQLRGQVEWSLEGAAVEMETISVAVGEQWRREVSVTAPKGGGRLLARLISDERVTLSKDTLAIRSIPPRVVKAPTLRRKLAVYAEPNCATVEQMRKAGLSPVVVDDVPSDPANTILVIAPGASDRNLNRQVRAIREFLEGDGAVLCLAQEQWPGWSPLKMEFWPSIRAVPPAYADFGWSADSKDLYFSMRAPIYAPGHPAFDGLHGSDLRWWSRFDGRVSDDGLVRPSAVGVHSPGAWRVLAGGCRRENASLVEARVGPGALIFCQARVIDNFDNAEARGLLMNLLRRLDNGNPVIAAEVNLAGRLTVTQLAALTGVDPKAFGSARAEDGMILIATDGASPDEVEAWVAGGGQALVLSAEVANRLPGYAVEKKKDMVYAASRGDDYSLFWGVSSANFSNFDESCVQGALTKYPDSARVLLNGLVGKAWQARLKTTGISPKGIVTMDGAGPVAVAERRGRGALIVTTMTPWRGRTAQDLETISTILANAGLSIPLPDSQPRRVRVFKTVPLKIDGALDDWTYDLEDRNVSPYRHAQPVVLTSEAIASPVEASLSDRDLSAIVYFLWDAKNLHIAGVVFGAVDQSRVEIRIGDQTLQIEPSGQTYTASVDGKEAGATPIASKGVDAKELTDARALSFTEVDRRVGHLKAAAKVKGRSFEWSCPWRSLGMATAPETAQALVRVVSEDEAILMAPLDADVSDRTTWLRLDLEP